MTNVGTQTGSHRWPLATFYIAQGLDLTQTTREQRKTKKICDRWAVFDGTAPTMQQPRTSACYYVHRTRGRVTSLRLCSSKSKNLGWLVFVHTSQSFLNTCTWTRGRCHGTSKPHLEAQGISVLDMPTPMSTTLVHPGLPGSPQAQGTGQRCFKEWMLVRHLNVITFSHLTTPHMTPSLPQTHGPEDDRSHCLVDAAGSHRLVSSLISASLNPRKSAVPHRQSSC